MPGILDSVDKGLAGFSFSSQFTNIQTHGPLPYTTYDFLKHFSGSIAIIKFLAHIFSLPLMVMLRRDFGCRYVDGTHVTLSFVIWHVAGMFSFGDGLLNQLASPIISIVAWLFLPIAFYHQHRAKHAALKGEGYSYYPGMPRLAGLTLRVVGGFFRILGGVSQRWLGPVPHMLTHPAKHFTPDMIQGLVRRFVEPLIVIFIGAFIAVSGISPGFGVFLIWTGILLHLDETISLRTEWEAFLDQVDAHVMAQEKQRFLAGDRMSSTHGFSLASLAHVERPNTHQE